MKKSLILVCLLLLSSMAIHAQNEVNLFQNGDFQNGTTGWNLGQDFTLGGDSSYRYVETGYCGTYCYPSLSTEDQVIENIGGNTYVFSFWTTAGKSDLKGYFLLEDNEENEVNNVEGIEGVSYNTFYFEVEEQSGGWVKLSKEITFPKNITKMKKFRINLFANKSSKRIAEVSLVKTSSPIPAPENLEVKNYQREALLSWDAVEGATAYSVKVGSADALVVSQTTYMVTDLAPGTTTSVVVKSTQEGALESTATITTAELSSGEVADRVPYVLLEDSVTSELYLHVYDATNAPVIEEVSLDGQVLTANAENKYSLAQGEGKTLKVTLKDGEQKWVLTYKVNVQ